LERVVELSQRRSLLIGRLKRRKTREREGLVLVEGVRAVHEALHAGAEVRFAVSSPRLAQTPAGARLLDALTAAGAEVVGIDDASFESLSDTSRSQGVLLVCAEPTAGLDRVRPDGCYLVLDALQDPGNLGTLVRAAVAFAVNGVLVLDGCVDPWGAKAVRASAGMVFQVPIVQAATADVLDMLEGVGVPVFVADAGGRDVELAWTGRPWALVIGNEGGGARGELREVARDIVRVAMPGGAESLNAGMAGAILLYALTRETDGV
jgi:TrmH family RNA methyltransferase